MLGFRSVVWGCESQRLCHSFTFSLRFQDGCCHSNHCLHSRQEPADSGNISKKFPGDTHLLLIGHKCVTRVLLVAGASRKVGLYLSCLSSRRKRKEIWISIAWANLQYLPYSLRKFPSFVVNTDMNFSYQNKSPLRFP